MFHVKRWLPLLAVAFGCTDLGDELFERPLPPADEVSPGVFRITRNLGPDFPRRALSGGRLLYLAADVAGFPAGWGFYSLNPDTTIVREEFGSYRRAFGFDRLADVQFHAGGRVVLTESQPIDFIHWCTEAAFRPRMRFVRFLDLPPADGPPISLLERGQIEPAVFTTAADSFGPVIRVRNLPAMADADALGANPWGPAVDAAGASAFVSDGESILRVALGGDTPWAPESLAQGVSPALAPDGSRLLYARANITDSVLRADTTLLGLGFCAQTTVLYTVAEWNTFSMDLNTGVEQLVTRGAEPAFLDPSTIIVRRPNGFYRVDLDSGAATALLLLPGIASPVVLDDGAVAFSADLFGGRDIFLIRP